MLTAHCCETWWSKLGSPWGFPSTHCDRWALKMRPKSRWLKMHQPDIGFLTFHCPTITRFTISCLSFTIMVWQNLIVIFPLGSQRYQGFSSSSHFSSSLLVSFLSQNCFDGDKSDKWESAWGINLGSWPYLSCKAQLSQGFFHGSSSQAPGNRPGPHRLQHRKDLSAPWTSAEFYQE